MLQAAKQIAALQRGDLRARITAQFHAAARRICFVFAPEANCPHQDPPQATGLVVCWAVQYQLVAHGVALFNLKPLGVVTT